MPEQLGPRTLKALRFIEKFTADKCMPPSIKEIADHLEITPPSALAQVVRLESAGFIKRTPKKWRSIQVINPSTGANVPVREMLCIPVVGNVAAGPAILAQENITGHLSVDPSHVRAGGTHFALKVKGDSMTGVDIQDGDLLIVRQQPVADNGDIVVALLGDEGTVKRLKMEQDRIELMPENPRHKPIRVERGDEFRIVGKAMAVYRISKECGHRTPA